MRLSGTFFTVISINETGNGSEPRLVSPAEPRLVSPAEPRLVSPVEPRLVSSAEPLIRLEPDNVIFKAHFPDYPITPGAVQIRVATELLEMCLNKSLTLSRVADLKFMEPLYPGAEVAYSFTKLVETDESLKVELSVRSEEKVFSRMSLEYTIVVRRSSHEPVASTASTASTGSATTATTATTGPVTEPAEVTEPIEVTEPAVDVSAWRNSSEAVAELAEAPGLLTNLKTCVIIPVYNNAGTIKDVVQRTLKFCKDVIVVDDGSTDGSSDSLSELSAVVVRYERNRGKGYALKTGFIEAKARGFERAITIDADGQHFPEDIPVFAAQAREHPGAMLVGSRNLRMENMPGGNTFANKFSNFWFRLQTGVNLPDTQSGFRLYQLNRIGRLRFLTYRYEAELELLVFQCWKGVPMIPVGIKVYYPPEGERVTHFRPFWDFFRISVLNTALCVLAIFYGLPSRLLRKK